ncbi:hypothetical protein CR194_03365 [Salipaludibacillus keqinensis]|uniref:Uncharacterized protein n=1 Tax=Salipaludibacillus keqinensis TaxID=2045207 RepID=A0A323TKT2_9BACI|nr:hypothetical protein [Salipaludibacillus keqinensis]PYZ94584.1 hypothetical protein CR194_03365 [Salipaludibacillus keqinensis]
MNRGKSYRILIIVLFFAFVSLLSRSLVYLVISLTIAVLIIVLLSRDVKQRERNNREVKNTIPNTETSKDQFAVERTTKIADYSLAGIFLVLGVLMGSYGLTGFFEIEGIFHQLGWMTEESFVIIVFIVVGMLLILYGLSILLKRWLS